MRAPEGVVDISMICPEAARRRRRPLDGLDLGVRLVLRDGRADLGRVEEDDLAQESCAYQVMPRVACSPSTRAQSCSAW
jgi:hypothetical protein